MCLGLNIYHCCGNIPLRNGLEREPLRYCKGDGNVTFTKPFLMLGKVTFDEHVNVLERYCTHLLALFPKLRVLKGLILCSFFT